MNLSSKSEIVAKKSLLKLAVIIWTPIAVYCLLCIVVPKLRVLRWQGTNAKVGTLGHLAFTTLSLVPAVISIFPQWFGWIVLPLVIGGFTSGFVGFLLDSKKQKSP